MTRAGQEYSNPILETLDPEQLRAMQLRKFQKVFRWVYDRSPLYRRNYDRTERL